MTIKCTIHHKLLKYWWNVLYIYNHSSITINVSTIEATCVNMNSRNLCCFLTTAVIASILSSKFQLLSNLTIFYYVIIYCNIKQFTLFIKALLVGCIPHLFSTYFISFTRNAMTQYQSFVLALSHCVHDTICKVLRSCDSCH